MVGPRTPHGDDRDAETRDKGLTAAQRRRVDGGRRTKRLRESMEKVQLDLVQAYRGPRRGDHITTRELSKSGNRT